MESLEALEVFKNIIEKSNSIAIASSSNNVPNVRILSYYFDDSCNKIFISTFKQSSKVKEFEDNACVAFTTVPADGTSFVRAKGKIEKSNMPIEEIYDKFDKKYPGFKEQFLKMANAMVGYEVCFKEADVVREMGDIGKVTF